MAGPYSGASIAADALSRAISEMFKGMVTGQDRAAQVELQQEEIGRSRRHEAIEQAFIPQRWRKGELDISGAELTQQGERQRQSFEAQAHPLLQQNRQLGNELLQNQIKTEGLRPKVMQAEINQTEIQIKRLNQQIAQAEITNPLEASKLQQELAALKAEHGHKLQVYQNYTQALAQRPLAIEELTKATGDTKSAIAALAKWGHVFIDSGLTNHPVFRLLIEQIEAASPGSSIMRAVVDDTDRKAKIMTEAFIGRPDRPYTSEEVLVAAWIYKYALASTLKLHTGSLVHPQQGVLTVPPMPKYLQDKLTTPAGQSLWNSFASALGLTAPEYGKPAAMTKEELEKALPHVQAGEDLASAKTLGAAGLPAAPTAPVVAPKPAETKPTEDNAAKLNKLNAAAQARYGKNYADLPVMYRDILWNELFGPLKKEERPTAIPQLPN